MEPRKRRPWGRIALGIVVGLLAIVGSAWLWLTAREAVPATSSYRIDLAELRALGDAVPGSKPTRVNSALVAEATLPRAAVFAGESFTPQPFVHQVFQLPRPDGSYLLIDAAFPPDRLADMSDGTFHADAYAAVQRALGQAEQVVITHEHFDHLAGVSTIPADKLSGRLALTAEQLGNTRALDDASIPDATRKALAPLAFERTKAIAPGVVLQKAAGHTPGSQIIFVQTQNGQEYLFIGDVAWHLDQIRDLHYRPRLVTQLFLGEDREAVLAEFRTLHELMAANPNLLVVVSHDRDQRQQLLASGKLSDGLQ
jgi:glyoxylase-like metal-dependent hydrolase (beta-lactamase superfamily II)